jgi:hypothetical protein
VNFFTPNRRPADERPFLLDPPPRFVAVLTCCSHTIRKYQDIFDWCQPSFRFKHKNDLRDPIRCDEPAERNELVLDRDDTLSPLENGASIDLNNADMVMVEVDWSS